MTRRCGLPPAPLASQTPPAGPAAFAVENTGTGSVVCVELWTLEAFGGALHRGVPAGWLISPHLTDGQLWPQGILIL